jgi:hypothetical protein
VAVHLYPRTEVTECASCRGEPSCYSSSTGIGLSPPGESRKPAASEVVPQSAPEPERAEKAEPRKIRPSDGEAACYDEAAFQLLVASLQKIKERYARNLINIVERDQYQQKLVNDFDHLVARGPSTESCILQQLGLVKSLYDDQLINIVQRDASREILYTNLHNLCMPKATDTTPIANCLNLMNVAYDQQLINIVQRDASRQRLWKTVHDLLLARAQTEKEIDQALDVVKQLYEPISKLRISYQDNNKCHVDHSLKHCWMSRSS